MTVILIGKSMKRKLHYRDFDKLLFLMPILIFVIGILSIYSASFKSIESPDLTLVTRQILWMSVGSLLVFLVIRLDYFRLQDWVWPIYFTSILLLVLVLWADQSP